MKESSDSYTVRRLAMSIMAVIVLTVCLCITTYALVMVSVGMSGNYFHTGTIAINLNDGEPVIDERELLFCPGMSIEREFFIKNDSTWDVYYRIYFDETEGGLSDVLRITVKSGSYVLFEGTAKELSRQNVRAGDDELRPGEKRNLKVIFEYPEEATNETQDMSLTFKLCADAVQTKNNPYRSFE